MRIFGLTIMTSRAYNAAVGDCFEVGRKCGRVAERYGLPPTGDEVAANLGMIGEVYELGHAAGRAEAETEARERALDRRHDAAERSRQRRRRGHLHAVRAATDDIA